MPFVMMPAKLIPEDNMPQNPIAPRNSPSARPVPSSFTKTRHQSRNISSRNASERMMIVVACPPLLPPLLMISGMKYRAGPPPSGSHVRNVPWLKRLMFRRGATASHPPRLRIICQKFTCL